MAGDATHQQKSGSAAPTPPAATAGRARVQTRQTGNDLMVCFYAPTLEGSHCVRLVTCQTVYISACRRRGHTHAQKKLVKTHHAAGSGEGGEGEREREREREKEQNFSCPLPPPLGRFRDHITSL